MYRFEFCFADFQMIASDDVTVKTQRKLHELLAAVVHGIYENPLLIGLDTGIADEYLHPHETLNARPVFYKNVKKIWGTALEFFDSLLQFGLRGKFSSNHLTVDSLKLKRIYAECLEHFEFVVEGKSRAWSLAYPECPEILGALKLLSAACGPDVLRFSHYVPDGDYWYMAKRIEALLMLEDGFFDSVVRKYSEKGYGKTCKEDFFRMCLMCRKNVGGLSIEFTTTMGPTVRFVNCTCIGIKAALEHAHEIDDTTKRQLVKFCKLCNNCMGCTKGGKNKPFTVAVPLSGNESRLCPEFVQMEWFNSDISKEKIDFLLALSEMQECYGKSRKKAK